MARRKSKRMFSRASMKRQYRKFGSPFFKNGKWRILRSFRRGGNTENFGTQEYVLITVEQFRRMKR